MKKSLSHTLAAGALAAATLIAASPAQAQPIACGYQPGMLAWLSGSVVRPAGPCVYQGDYMVQQAATYDGPAVIAPQPTYSPSRSYPTYTANYIHGPYYAPGPAVRRTTVRRVTRSAVRHANVKSEGNGKVQVVRARAEVKIYGPQRMDIKLYRN